MFFVRQLIQAAFFSFVFVTSALMASSGPSLYDPNKEIESLQQGREPYAERRYTNVKQETTQQGILDVYINLRNSVSDPQYRPVHGINYQVTQFTPVYCLVENKQVTFEITDEELQNYGTLFNRATSKELDDMFWGIYYLDPAQDGLDKLWFGLLYEKVQQ